MRSKQAGNALAPGMAVLSRLASLVAHIEEATSATGHPFDGVAIRALVADPEVQEWMSGMRKLALVPVARRAADPLSATGKGE